MRVTAGRAVKDRNKRQQEKYPEERGRSGRNKRRRDKHQKSVFLTVGYVGETWESVCHQYVHGHDMVGGEQHQLLGLGWDSVNPVFFLFLTLLPKSPRPSLL